MSNIIFWVLLIAGWQGLYYLFVDILAVVKSYAIPSPIGVATSFISLCQDGTLLQAILYSLGRSFLGYFCAVLIGVCLGLLINRSKYLKKHLRPLILGMQTLPSVCFVPFSILWFGLSNQAILFVVIMGATFSVAISVDNAINNIPSIYLKVAKTMGIQSTKLYRHVVLPACFPELISGLKQSWSFAWRALMAGEVMTTSIGLGQTLMLGRDLADINQVMLVMIVIVLVGILIDKLVFQRLENKLVKY